MRAKCKPASLKSPAIESAANPDAQAALAVMEEGKGAARFAAAKTLVQLSQLHPDEVYPHFDRIAALLDCDNKIISWNAIAIIAHLAPVDRQMQIDKLLDRYLAPIDGPAMITAANTIIAAGRIAAAKPALADRIIRAILRVQKARYQTAECRNVAIGHALKVFASMLELVSARDDVRQFVHRQLRNSRNSTRKKAQLLLAQLDGV